MILIDLSKSLHEGRGKKNDKKKTAVVNDKVAIINPNGLFDFDIHTFA